eukprot:GHVN01068547.1.p2 GENE.GHVN01068547.1~~GHVN01068547.1.p2  ORF type:complete len:359 (+),score=37.67 GHVN01068547.1:2889-3965(+)
MSLKTGVGVCLFLVVFSAVSNSTVGHDASGFLSTGRTLFRSKPESRRFLGAANSASAKTVLLFPGQGAQVVGMGKEKYDESDVYREHYSRASEILGYDLARLSFEGPKEQLDKTSNCQPAIFVNSVAALRAHEKVIPQLQEATLALGLSLGEYSALCAAGAISFEDGVRLTQARGAAMQSAAETSDSGMLAILGLDSATVGVIARKAAEETGESLEIANYLCPGNYVLSGGSKACLHAAQIAKPEFKARLATKLAVAGAFHTAYMAPAVDQLREALFKANIATPKFPVVSNVDAAPHTDPAEIQELLLRQLTSPVLFENSLRLVMNTSFENGYEIGPGNVIGGLIKRLNKEKVITSLD